MLHVLVGASCNNNCIFCMESDRPGRRKHVDAQTPDDIRSMIEDYPFKSEILFTSGEPSLNPDLPDYIARAKRSGFATIGLITNGRRFAYPDYAGSLVQKGLNKVTVSIHGHTAQLHDSLTRSRGSFEQSISGLENLAQLKATRRIELHTSTVVVKRNLEHVSEIYRFLMEFQVDRLCFNVMMVKGRGEEKFDLLMARYGEISKTFKNLAEQIGPEGVRQVSLADVPRCAAEGLAFELIGDQEAFEQFEFLGSNGIAQLSAEQLASIEGSGLNRHTSAEALRQKVEGEPALCADADYYLTTRELKDNILRVKQPACRECRLESRCPGVWKVYVDHYGWSELAPIR